MKEWLVASAGRSLKDFSPTSDLWDLPSVAINRAWYRDPKWFDVWSVQENPRKLWIEHGRRVTGENRKDDGMLVPTRDLMRDGVELRAWAPAGPHAKAWTKLPVDLETFGYPGDMVTPWGASDWFWRMGTMMSTLTLCIRKGAERIVLVGADLDGTQGYLAGTPSKVARCDARWKKERTALELAIKQAAQHGVEIEWSRPDGQEEGEEREAREERSDGESAGGQALCGSDAPLQLRVPQEDGRQVRRDGPVRVRQPEADEGAAGDGERQRGGDPVHGLGDRPDGAGDLAGDGEEARSRRDVPVPEREDRP